MSRHKRPIPCDMRQCFVAYLSLVGGSACASVSLRHVAAVRYAIVDIFVFEKSIFNFACHAYQIQIPKRSRRALLENVFFYERLFFFILTSHRIQISNTSISDQPCSYCKLFCWFFNYPTSWAPIAHLRKRASRFQFSRCSSTQTCVSISIFALLF